MHPRFLILGKNGQIGSALVKQLGDRALAAGREEANFLDTDFIPKLESWIGNQQLAAVINTAAYTRVDRAEAEEKETAWRVNAAAVDELAAWCKRRELPLVHYSSDYVFDGTGSAAYREESPTSPVNGYGESKLAGERAIMKHGGLYFIFRTSWVYNAHGKNFFTTIVRMLREKDSINVVADQVGAPTYAPHLAAATLQALEKVGLPRRVTTRNEDYGLYHLCHGGETSWHGFAQAIFALARTYESGQASPIKCQQIIPVPSSAYPLPAQRPLNSRLNCTHARNVLGIALPHWKVGLKECFEEAYAGFGEQAGGGTGHSAQGAGG